jgi:hypothetical protein
MSDETFFPNDLAISEEDWQHTLPFVRVKRNYTGAGGAVGMKVSPKFENLQGVKNDHTFVER